LWLLWRLTRTSRKAKKRIELPAMTDRTRQIVEALMKAPELVQALRRDPEGFAAQFGVNPDVLHAGRRVISDVISRLSTPGLPQFVSGTSDDSPMPSHANAMTGRACTHGSSGVPLVAVMSLAAITGMLAVLGTVSVVGVGSNRNSNAA
jgi:hypothetical protein